MARNPYTEGDFDRLMFYPLGIGGVLFCWFGWNVIDTYRRFGDWSMFDIKMAVLGFALIIFGITWLSFIKPKNPDGR